MSQKVSFNGSTKWIFLDGAVCGSDAVARSDPIRDQFREMAAAMGRPDLGSALL